VAAFAEIVVNVSGMERVLSRTRVQDETKTMPVVKVARSSFSCRAVVLNASDEVNKDGIRIISPKIKVRDAFFSRNQIQRQDVKNSLQFGAFKF